ncbi:hypothetical protein [Xenorhabdus khoisanae]|uniref:hypothetical protein n=1 Tax=Xenorhabdus khoisanae TaxID=880157 RepID=UPI0013793AC9|nr:hypothetical protein [Xenorhabdus khoisanae]
MASPVNLWEQELLTTHSLYWSTWRRRHQYCAQQCHYRRRNSLMITERLRL